jgi:ferredoxin-NADP reductase
MKYIDNFLNGITMYKLVLYGLFILTGLSILFGFVGLVPFSGLHLLYTFFTLTIVCYTTNELLGKLLKVQLNIESSSITALILFLVVFPVSDITSFMWVALAGFIAMASKYILAINKKHVFNPVAISLVILGLFGSGLGGWWVASTTLLVPTAILGFLVLRKIRRFQMFFVFLVTAIISIFITRFSAGIDIWDLVKEIFTSWPIIFFGTIMFTEPLTTPPSKKLQFVYAFIVGSIFGMQLHWGSLYTTPELALVIGNIFSYLVSPKYRLVLTLSSKDTINEKGDVDEFRFDSDKKISFKPGQYLEWTLGHDKPDSRGNRRYFTISSSPTEEKVMLGIKYYDKPSSFKMKLGQLKVGEKIHAGSLSGEFTMPDDLGKKLVFIAGGIGVTPFRSMAKYMIDKKEKRDVVLLYSNKTPGDVAYKNIFDESESVGLKTLYYFNDLEGATLSPNMRLGFINAEAITKEIPDYKERMFYISGPHGMVTAFQDSLSKLGIKSSNIKTDFFPGFV